MVIYIAPDVSREKMSMLFQDMVHVWVYMDDLVIIRDGKFMGHMYIIDAVLNW